MHQLSSKYVHLSIQWMVSRVLLKVQCLVHYEQQFLGTMYQISPDNDFFETESTTLRSHFDRNLGGYKGDKSEYLDEANLDG